MASLGASEGKQTNPTAVRFCEPPRCAREIVHAAVAAAFTVPLGELRASTRRAASVALARQSAMYLAHVALGLSFSEVGRAFGRDRTTAAHACRRIEDRRADHELDRTLAELEHALRRNVDATFGAVS
jgi:chromosomal replication initiation ATPase DnaA